MKRDTGPNALRRGRDSRPGVNYFLTICVADRHPVLQSAVATHLLQALREPESGSIWRLRCGTIMPDHIHCLIELGSVHSLSRALGRFKALTKPTVIAASASASWQENFYDHRLRSNESVEPVIRYIHSNPYRAGLVAVGATWPWFYCAPDDWTWFSGLTDEGPGTASGSTTRTKAPKRPWPSIIACSSMSRGMPLKNPIISQVQKGTAKVG